MFETNNKERLIQKQKDCPVKNKKQLNILKEKNHCPIIVYEHVLFAGIITKAIPPLNHLNDGQ